MKKIDNLLDSAWSLLIKLRADNKCEKCYKITYLNSHHIFSRSNKSVRWNIDNGVCLCAGCHALKNDSAHKDPLTFGEWIKNKRGEKWYQNLMIRAHSVGKLHVFEKEIILKELQKEINEKM
ncbi:MAG: hypothetical protein HN704_18320 [Bacteroidetes bacterium]|jgi:hypothetical protein|nr:hypothetical protein [Bacteroidota bacterium]MBT7493559.1 hypothetical protein [Bacteroidota bacterium]